jgi:hypothetical protein
VNGQVAAVIRVSVPFRLDELTEDGRTLEDVFLALTGAAT